MSTRSKSYQKQGLLLMVCPNIFCQIVLCNLKARHIVQCQMMACQKRFLSDDTIMIVCQIDTCQSWGAPKYHYHIFQGFNLNLKTFYVTNSKAEFAEEGTFFANRFPSLRTFVNKKLDIEKKQAHFYYISFKSCILGGLSFFKFQPFY